jgi:hypothetical protein
MQNTYRANHHLRFELKSRSWRGVLDTTLCDKVCQWLATGRWFSLISSTNKNDCHDIAEILMKMALNTISQTPSLSHDKRYSMILSCHDEGNDLQIKLCLDGQPLGSSQWYGSLNQLNNIYILNLVEHAFLKLLQFVEIQINLKHETQNQSA